MSDEADEPTWLRRSPGEPAATGAPDEASSDEPPAGGPPPPWVRPAEEGEAATPPAPAVPEVEWTPPWSGDGPPAPRRTPVRALRVWPLVAVVAVVALVAWLATTLRVKDETGPTTTLYPVRSTTVPPRPVARPGPSPIRATGSVQVAPDGRGPITVLGSTAGVDDLGTGSSHYVARLDERERGRASLRARWSFGPLVDLDGALELTTSTNLTWVRTATGSVALDAGGRTRASFAGPDDWHGALAVRCPCGPGPRDRLVGFDDQGSLASWIPGRHRPAWTREVDGTAVLAGQVGDRVVVTRSQPYAPGSEGGAPLLWSVAVATGRPSAFDVGCGRGDLQPNLRDAAVHPVGGRDAVLAWRLAERSVCLVRFDVHTGAVRWRRSVPVDPKIVTAGTPLDELVAAVGGYEVVQGTRPAQAVDEATGAVTYLAPLGTGPNVVRVGATGPAGPVAYGLAYDRGSAGAALGAWDLRTGALRWQQRIPDAQPVASAYLGSSTGAPRDVLLASVASGLRLATFDRVTQRVWLTPVDRSTGALGAPGRSLSLPTHKSISLAQLADAPMATRVVLETEDRIAVLPASGERGVRWPG